MITYLLTKQKAADCEEALKGVGPPFYVRSHVMRCYGHKLQQIDIDSEAWADWGTREVAQFC